MGTRTAQGIWEAALGELQIQVNKPNYRTWFGKTIGLDYRENEFVVGVPNTFVAEYLDQNQRSLIEKALIGLTSPDVRVVFQVNGRNHDGSGEAQGNGLLQTNGALPTKFNPKYDFDSFIEGGCNRLARAAALSVAKNPGHSYNPLFIYGGVGLGKTHLLHAIGHMAQMNSFQVICTSAEQFTNEFVKAVRERRTEEFRNKYRSVGILLVDDIQFISGKEQTEESFFHTFNELHNTNRQIVMTSDCPPNSMPRLEERLRSRFEWGLIVDIQPPDLETRMAILQSKVKQRAASVPGEVLEFVARQAQRNVRELEGALNRVIAFARLLGAPPTAELAARALESLADKAPASGSLTPRLLIEAVAEGFQITAADLLGRERNREISLARRVAMYLLRRETSCSLAQIGQELGGRDAAAVTNGCKKLEGDISASPYLQRKVSEIKLKISPVTKS
ncbi:MAG: chromosomal replication initiator protein DnaA [Chloroflexota bacterium]